MKTAQPPLYNSLRISRGFAQRLNQDLVREARSFALLLSYSFVLENCVNISRPLTKSLIGPGPFTSSMMGSAFSKFFLKVARAETIPALWFGRFYAIIMLVLSALISAINPAFIKRQKPLNTIIQVFTDMSTAHFKRVPNILAQTPFAVVF